MMQSNQDDVDCKFEAMYESLQSNPVFQKIEYRLSVAASVLHKAKSPIPHLHAPDPALLTPSAKLKLIEKIRNTPAKVSSIQDNLVPKEHQPVIEPESHRNESYQGIPGPDVSLTSHASSSDVRTSLMNDEKTDCIPSEDCAVSPRQRLYLSSSVPKQNEKSPAKKESNVTDALSKEQTVDFSTSESNSVIQDEGISSDQYIKQIEPRNKRKSTSPVKFHVDSQDATDVETAESPAGTAESSQTEEEPMEISNTNQASAASTDKSRSTDKSGHRMSKRRHHAKPTTAVQTAAKTTPACENDLTESSSKEDVSLPSTRLRSSKLRHSKPVDGDLHSAGKDVRVMDEWSLLCHHKRIFLHGHIRGEAADDFWRSSVIANRKNSRLVVTRSGTLYRLIGTMKTRISIQNGVPSALCRHFKFGFPENWQEIVQKELSGVKCQGKEEKKADPMNEQTPSNKSVIDVNSLPCTSSGRRVFPPLAKWANQRVVCYRGSGGPVVSAGTPDTLITYPGQPKKSSRARRKNKPGGHGKTSKSSSVKETSPHNAVASNNDVKPKVRRKSRVLDSSQDTSDTALVSSRRSHKMLTTAGEQTANSDDLMASANSESATSEPLCGISEPPTDGLNLQADIMGIINKQRQSRRQKHCLRQKTAVYNIQKGNAAGGERSKDVKTPKQRVSKDLLSNEVTSDILITPDRPTVKRKEESAPLCVLPDAGHIDEDVLCTPSTAVKRSTKRQQPRGKSGSDLAARGSVAQKVQQRRSQRVRNASHLPLPVTASSSCSSSEEGVHTDACHMHSDITKETKSNKSDTKRKSPHSGTEKNKKQSRRRGKQEKNDLSGRPKTSDEKHAPPNHHKKTSTESKSSVNDLPCSKVKATGKNSKGQKQAAVTVPGGITAGKGTMKRKRQMRQLIDDHNKDHSDDVFDTTPFKKLKKLPLSNLSGSVFNASDGTSSAFKTPRLFRGSISHASSETPISSTYTSPGLLGAADRDMADKYLHRFFKTAPAKSRFTSATRVTPAVTPTSSTLRQTLKSAQLSEVSPSIFTRNKVFNLDDDDDDDDDDDLYFSDSD